MTYSTLNHKSRIPRYFENREVLAIGSTMFIQSNVFYKLRKTGNSLHWLLNIHFASYSHCNRILRLVISTFLQVKHAQILTEWPIFLESISECMARNQFTLYILLAFRSCQYNQENINASKFFLQLVFFSYRMQRLHIFFLKMKNNIFYTFYYFDLYSFLIKTHRNCIRLFCHFFVRSAARLIVYFVCLFL